MPVVGSNKGAIPEALNEEVSILVDPNAENLEGAIRKLYLDKATIGNSTAIKIIQELTGIKPDYESPLATVLLISCTFYKGWYRSHQCKYFHA